MANFDRGLTHTSLSFLLKEAEEDKPVVVEFSEL